MDSPRTSEAKYKNGAIVEAGRMTLFHATNRTAGLAILREGRMIPGRCGIFGGGIYFGVTPIVALHQSAYADQRDGMIIVAEVNMGHALVLEGIEQGLDLVRLRQRGADSVIGRARKSAEWQYAVFESSRVRVIRGEQIREHLTEFI
jgi:hypothetical protein